MILDEILKIKLNVKYNFDELMIAKRGMDLSVFDGKSVLFWKDDNPEPIRGEFIRVPNTEPGLFYILNNSDRAHGCSEGVNYYIANRSPFEPIRFKYSWAVLDARETDHIKIFS